MNLRLAYRNLVHDRLRLAITLVGIVFAVVLVGVQSGLYLGFARMIGGPVENADADLWVMARGTQFFDDAGLLPAGAREAIRDIPGIARAEPLLVRILDWNKPDGTRIGVVLVGSDPTTGLLHPWNRSAARPGDLHQPDSVVVDETYLGQLGATGIEDTVELQRRQTRIVGLTRGIRSFTTLPYVFASLETARPRVPGGQDRDSFLLLRLDPGADRTAVAAAITERLHRTETLSTEAFAKRTRDYWLNKTGAGAALMAGVILGLVVGAVIVAQTLYASTVDHLGEFATLRALGAGGGYILRVIAWQATIGAVAGYAVGIGICLAVIEILGEGSVPILITPLSAAGLFAAVLVMCLVAALASIQRVLRLDPASVFQR